jgi:hypothetical protein
VGMGHERKDSKEVVVVKGGKGWRCEGHENGMGEVYENGMEVVYMEDIKEGE